MRFVASVWQALAATVLVVLSFAAAAQPVLQSSQTAVGTGNATVTTPAATVSGDLLVVGLMIEKGAGETITAPAGWNLILRTNNGSDVGMATYYKVAGGAEPASFTFNIANGSKWSIGISRITGAFGGNPINASGAQTGPSSTSVTSPSVTTTLPNSLVLAFYTNKKAATYTAAGTTTERYDVPNGPGGLPSNMMATFVQAAAGATGNRTATASEAEFWVGQQVAIRAAGAMLSSAANQTFNVGGASTPASTITINDATPPTITAANDLRIRIPASFNMTWDTSVTTVTLGGSAAGKVSATVAGYENANRTVVLNVTANFAGGDQVTVSGLAFTNFTANSAADNLELVVAGAGGATEDEDDKTITIVTPPATKLYFHNATSPNLGTLPAATTLSAITPNVTAAGAGTNRDMDETIGTAQVSAALTTAGQTSLQRNWFRRFVSRPLAAQTLPTGAWTIQGGASESNAASNMLLWGAVIRVWRPSTGTSVATLIDDPVLGNVEPGTSQTNVSRSTPSIAGVAVQDGDVLVIELWSENTQGNATARTNTIFYDGTTEGSTTSNAAFLQAPGAIAFYRSLRQSAYRLFSNTDSTNVGVPLAATDTGGVLASTGAAFRLRTLIHVADINLAANGQSFKLQYVGKGSGTCASPSGGTPAAWTDVTAATAIAFNNNATPADGAALTANANDPTHGGDTIVNQTYEEANNFTNSTAISRGQDGKWDFALRDNGAPGSTTYCLRVVKSSGTALDSYFVYPEITTASAPAIPGSFNAFESSTAANATTGQLYTKRSSVNFALDVVAVLAGVQMSTFTDTVLVDLVTGSSGGANCPGTPVQVPGSSQSVGLTGGRGTTGNFNVASAFPDIRVRIRYPVASPTVTSCSSDNFAVRPSAFTLTSSNATNNGTSGTPAIKTGANFNLTASTGVAGYNGTPTIDNTQVAGSPNAGTIGGSFGAANPANGAASGSGFSYSEVGTFGLNANAVRDTSFTAVDQPNDCTADFSNALVGGKYGCYVGSSLVAMAPGTSGFGRFIPDHFVLTAHSITPRSDFAGCSGSTFTYLGERMDLHLTLQARNASGAATANYALAYAKFDLSSGSYGLGAIDVVAPTLLTSRIGMLPPTIVSNWASGSAQVTVPVTIGRNAAPDGPYSSVRVGVALVDADSVAMGSFDLDADNSGSNERVQVGGNQMLRFGRLRLENAVGSEKLDLPMPMQTQYWNGTAFLANAEDDCTVISAANAALSNYQGGITAANVPASHISGLGVAVVDGIRNFTLLKPSPTPVASGAVTLTVDLSAAGLSYLQGNWGVTTFTANPSARAAFGLFGAQPNSFIYFRENF